MTNIALVVLDTLRKDAFDRHFDWLPGRRYDRAFSTANWTVPAHASLFTGLYASEVGVHAKHTAFDVDRPVLAERLRDGGYRTRAFSANTNITGHFQFDRGFEDFHSPDRLEHLTDDRLFDWREFNQQTTASGARKYLQAVAACVRRDVDTIPSLLAGARLLRDDTGVAYGGTREAIDSLRTVSFGDHEFLFCNLMETHEPYRVPGEYQTVDEPPLTDSVGDFSVGQIPGGRTRVAYDDCARYFSDVYREFFELLDAEFDYVITLSDHGELLGEHDAWGHEYGVYPELTHVPLVVSGDGFSGASDDVVSLLDVHETVLDLAGLATDASDTASDSRGRSLRGGVDRDHCLTEYLGLTSWSEQKLVENGAAGSLGDYERHLRGYATDSGLYGYETRSEFAAVDTRRTGVEDMLPTGKSESPVESRMGSDGHHATSSADTTVSEATLRDLVADLDVRAVETDQSVPDEVEDRLEDLGYA